MPHQDCLPQADLGMLYRLQQAKWNVANTTRDRTIRRVPQGPGNATVIF